MTQFAIVLFDLFLIVFVVRLSLEILESLWLTLRLPSFGLVERFYMRPGKRIKELKILRRQIEHRRCWDRDILTPKQVARVETMQEQISALLVGVRDRNDLEEVDKEIHDLNEDVKALHKTSVPGNLGFVKEWLELLIVVFGVVMGARALFLQPFKIPTGSMQPTLNGINFEHDDAAAYINPLQRLHRYVNHSWRYVDAEIEQDGAVTSLSRHNPFFFFPYTKLKIGDTEYKLPGEPGKVLDYTGINSRQHGSNFFRRGETLARGYLELGDHLFVDRVSLNFVEPKRGDVTVFTTDGIRDKNGQALRGRFYIKRLVGLPKDELRIAGRRLYVKRPGEQQFALVDAGFHKAFDRIYSFHGGYRGYSNPQHESCQFLCEEGDTFTLDEDEYFLLGDNSENSQDSRYWGVVPRRNIIGRAVFVYWPFTRRWGPVDTVAPLPYASPPTVPAAAGL